MGIAEAQISLLVKLEKIPEANFGVYYLLLHEADGDFYKILLFPKIFMDIL